MKFIKYALVSIVALLLIVTAAAAIILPNLDLTKYKETIEAKASVALQTPVTIAKINTLKIWPKPTVEAEGIRIESHIGGKPLLQADKLLIRLDILDLLALKVGVDVIEIVKPDVYLVQTAEGQTWAAKQTEAEKNVASKGTSGEASEPAANPLEKLGSLGTISIVNGTLEYSDKVAGVSHVIKNMDVKLGAGDISETEIHAALTYNTVPIHVNGILDLGSLRKVPMDVQLNVNDNTVLMQGTLRDATSAPEFTGVVKADAKTLMATLNTMLGLKGEKALKEMPFSVDGDIQASATGFRTDQFVLKANETSAHVVANIQMADGGAVSGKATVSVPEFDGANWGACGAESAVNGSASTPSSTSGSKGSAERFSSEVIDFSALQKMNLTVNATVDKVLCNGLKIDGVNTVVTLNKGVVEIKPFSLRAAAGKVITNMTLDTRKERPEGKLNIDIAAFNLADMMESKVKLDAPLNGNVALTFVGKSAKAMVNNLNGTMAVSATEGELVGVPLGKLKLGLETFSGLVLGGGQNYKLEEFRLPVTVTNGVFKTEDTFLKLSQQTMSAKGEVSLPKWTINMDMTPVIGAGGTTLVTLPLKIKGPLDKPSLRPDMNSAQGIGAAIGTAVGGPLGTGVGAAVGSILGGQKKNADAAAEETKKKVDEAAEKLKGVLGF